MKVDFERLHWENYPSTDTPLNADNLNRLEEGVAGLYSDVAEIEEELGDGVGEYVTEWLDEHVTPGGSTIVVDDTLSVTGAAADAKKTGDEISDLKDGFDDLDDRVTALEQGGTGGGLTDDIKQALLQIAEKVAYIDEDGQDYYDALENALYPPAELVSISAVYTQSGTVYSTDSLDSLKADLVVTAHMSDSTTQTVTTYTLSGTLTVGTSTITVSYGGKTTTFNVTVTANILPTGYTRVDYISSADDSPASGDLGSSSYIRTDFPSSDISNAINYEFECKFQPLLTSPEYVLFGARDGISKSAAKHGILLYSNANATTLHLYDGSTGHEIPLTFGGIPVGATRTIKIVGGDVYVDGVLDTQTGVTNLSLKSNYKFWLFCRNQSNQTSSSNRAPMLGKVYSFSIKDENGNYVLRYIPCKRDSDDVYGMYDTVSESFLTSYTSVPFNGGNDE